MYIYIYIYYAYHIYIYIYTHIGVHLRLPRRGAGRHEGRQRDFHVQHSFGQGSFAEICRDDESTSSA